MEDASQGNTHLSGIGNGHSTATRLLNTAGSRV